MMARRTCLRCCREWKDGESEKTRIFSHPAPHSRICSPQSRIVAETASPRKRKRGPAESEQLVRNEDEVGDEDGWRWRDGMMAKRVKNQLVTRLPTSEELALKDVPPMQPVEVTVPQHDSSLSDRTSLSATRLSCDGPGIALIFGKFVDMY